MPSPEKREKIALFGGTFDPVHAGHMEVADQAVTALALSRVVFLPCRQSPHKVQRAGASEADRLAMLRLATQDQPWAVVDDWEYHQPVPSYSWRTAEAFQVKYPRARLSWLMGWDQWAVLPSWSRFDYLAELVSFIVHDRDGRGAEDAPSYPGVRVTFVSGHHPASSSRIRDLRATGQEAPAGWLAPSVQRYLEREALYR
ncbi:nicotinate (nicotinamide) nucleotide adenylyltransferase [Roseibacillus ishigakijimensis]|uniref:Probable nicotinate-nucleotide adenylyltransferase n=1 Tax=Roseibacillus ishigakijimensis TaxID=454146 RepID=A0A934VIE1_9BACT|nr:nicotinate (nicotinamide) nucleotide adenylyltransferase [Roseibacillus ishigakijimensis]MBK1834978.1 nicotinate (nicotinamide) nucleotide adenylyltransferase [Roseibacillus ishigakijimensis]